MILFSKLVMISVSDNPSTMGKFAPILLLSREIISAVGKIFLLNCPCEKRASLLPSQLFPFPSIVSTVLENDAAKVVF